MADRDYSVIYKPGSWESGFFIEFLYSPEDWILIERRTIRTKYGNIPLTRAEGTLLFDFFQQDDFFLHSREIRESLSVIHEKPLISRLRIKLRGVTALIPGTDIKIVPVRGQGYFLEIVVDNLWKTQ